MHTKVEQSNEVFLEIGSFFLYLIRSQMPCAAHCKIIATNSLLALE